MAGAESSRGQQGGFFFRGRQQEIERRAPGAQEAAEWRAPQHRLVVVEAPPASTFLTNTNPGNNQPRSLYKRFAFNQE